MLSNNQRYLSGCLLASIAGLMATQNAHAHFPWLTSDQEGRVLLFFSESPLDRDYHLPDVVADARVSLAVGDHEARELKLERVEDKDFVGRQSEPGVVQAGVVTTRCEYGVYHGTRLDYVVKHYAGPIIQTASDRSAESGGGLDATPIASKRGLKLSVTWQGEPLEGASVTLIDSGGESAEKKTNAKGRATFHGIAAGPIGFVIGYVDEKDSGELDGDKYTSASHYMTLTFDHQPQQNESAKTSSLPDLPEAIASFGAAAAGDYLYVYSGHTGGAHEHSRENLSQHFRRVKLTGGEWEELAMQTPLQGFALVAHGGKLYRVGGMNAQNSAEESDDLHSVDQFSCYDPSTNRWTELPALPEPRSSLDAVVVDGQLNVVGGWKLTGSAEGKWLDTAWRMDLDHPAAGWQKLATPPFQRRALAVSHLDGKIVAVGGMNEAGEISRRVDALDVKTGEWRRLADLPGDGMQGFGASAWNTGGRLFASGTDGKVYELTGDGEAWRPIAELADGRFFHRLLATNNNRLLVVAGSSLHDGHLADCEWVSLD